MEKIQFSFVFILFGLCAFANTNEVGTKKSESIQVLKNKVYSLSELNEALKIRKF